LPPIFTTLKGSHKKTFDTFCAALSGRNIFGGIAYPGWRRVRLTLGYYVLPLQGDPATTLNAITISNIMQTFDDNNFLRIIYWQKPHFAIASFPAAISCFRSNLLDLKILFEVMFFSAGFVILMFSFF